jgi:superfamily II DNA/RNA helicase
MLSKARPLLPVAVILVPTRELACGVYAMLQNLTKEGTNITSVLLIGGTPLAPQQLALKRGGK